MRLAPVVALLATLPALVGCHGEAGKASSANAGARAGRDAGSVGGGNGGSGNFDGGAAGQGGSGGATRTTSKWPPPDPCGPTMHLATGEAPPSPPAFNGLEPLPGEMPLQRLTRLEYANTIRDLLGVEVDLADGFALDQPTEVGFDTGAPVTVPEGRQLLMTSLTVAEAAVKRLPALLPSCCTPVPATEAAQEACAARFIDTLGGRAFRRPVVAEEGDRLLQLYRQQRQAPLGRDFADALRVTIAALLQSPQFLYHREIAYPASTQDGVIQLNEFELASRLSYLLWASMPDDELWLVARNGKLSGTIVKQAIRMLASPKARSAIENFHLQWLDLVELPELSRGPSFTPELANSMLAETREFVSSVLLGDARLSTLFTSPKGFVDASLARIYGVAAPTGSGLQPVNFDPAQRAGLLTQASVLTRYARGLDSDPIRRGAFVLGRVVLCGQIPLPPEHAPPLLEPVPGQTTRQRTAASDSAACARMCHDLIDPLGFAFEHYDGLGIYRTMEAGKPIDAQGSLDIGGRRLNFADAIELSRGLADAREVGECVLANWWRSLVKRNSTNSETTALSGIIDRQSSPKENIREMLARLVESQIFRYRKVGAGEVRR